MDFRDFIVLFTVLSQIMVLSYFGTARLTNDTTNLNRIAPYRGLLNYLWIIGAMLGAMLTLMMWFGEVRKKEPPKYVPVQEQLYRLE